MGGRPFPICIAILPSPSPHPAVPAPPISPPHHCATFPFRTGCAASTHILDLPLLRLPAPYHTRSLPYTVSAARAPAIPRTVTVFRIQNLNGAQMDREVWGCCACVQALARRGGRWREKYGMGRGAMEALARRSGAEPRRTGLVLGGRRGARWGSGCGGCLCVSPGGGGCGVGTPYDSVDGSIP
ncbi:hypothetical protein B0H14DRAFT_2681060 [Mycena olivaceomarginata]|nr:hypothetical protein B0H14DRAFT_2681060 [Mycena olivaceomarginata]